MKRKTSFIFSLIFVFFISPLFVFASFPKFELQSVQNVGKRDVLFVAYFDSQGESFRDELPRVWFEYQKEGGELKKTRENVRVFGSYPFSQRVYNLEPGTYSVFAFIHYKGEERKSGPLSFQILNEGENKIEREEKGEEPKEKDPLYNEYSAFEDYDTSRIIFDDQGNLKKNSVNKEEDELSSFQRFLQSFLAIFGLKSHDDSSRRNTSNGKRKEEEGKFNSQNNISNINNISHESAAYDDEKGEVIQYNTQYKRYYRTSSKRVMRETKTPSSFSLFLLLLILFFVLLLAFILRRIFFLLKRKKIFHLKNHFHAQIGEFPQNEEENVKSKKYYIPHRSIEDIQD